ncbi:TonB-dependent receptor [Thalassotalea sp. PLHSN55]|uniref:TonB-dependent receptor n=1 Tax=Thalassotalea sp. PLHSN55 TaxID=3435888 RepID=UPI003F8800DD
MNNTTFKLSALAVIIGMNVGAAYAAEPSIDGEQQANKVKTAAQKKAERNKEKAETEVIVVTGIKDSLSRALSRKRHAEFGMDSISAEDIGKLPDVEIGDVLERIAGVQVNRGDDGVVNGTSIRGLPGYFNRTLYNGRVIATSLSTERYFDSQIIPAAFMTSVDVHKTAMANDIEGGLAGVVNLKSVRAFDVGKKAVRFKATLSNPSNVDDVNTDVLAVFSDLYLDESVGFTFGVNHLQYNTESQKSLNGAPTKKIKEATGKDYDGNGIDNDGVDAAGNPTGSGQEYFVPASINYALDQNFRERTAAFANLEWRPTDDLRLFGEVLYSSYDTINNRSQLRFKPIANLSEGVIGSNVWYQGEHFDEQRAYLTALHPTNMHADISNQYNERESDVVVAFFDAEWFKDQWSFKFGTNIARSKTTQFQVEAINTTPNNSIDVLLDGSDIDNTWDITFTDPATAMSIFSTPENYIDLKINGQQVGAEYESNSWGLDFDVEYDFDISNDILSPTYVQFGLHYTEDESLALKPQSILGTQISFLPGADDMIYRSVSPTVGDWFDGALGRDYDSEMFSWMGPDLEAMIKQNNWTEETFREVGILTDEHDLGARDDLEEEIGAAYVRLNFENGSGDLTGNVGVRYVHTKQLVTGQKLDYVVDAGEGDYADEDYTPKFGARYVPGLVTEERNYYNYLPSLNLRYMATEDVVLRGAWSQTMSRPLRQDLRILDKVGTNDDHAKITQPSPDLNAFISENVDVSVEWYFDKSSALTLALFYKDIATLTQTKVTTEQEDNILHLESGTTYTDPEAVYYRKSDSTGSILQGATVGFEQPFEYLPSFLKDTGVKVNYTYIDNSRPDLMKNVSKDNLSATLYYDADLFDARLSYAYRGERARNIGIENVPDQWVRPSSTLNASFSYKPVQYLNINLGISNITDEPNRDYYLHGLTKSISDSGRTVSLSITGRL